MPLMPGMYCGARGKVCPEHQLDVRQYATNTKLLVKSLKTWTKGVYDKKNNNPVTLNAYDMIA